MNEITNIENALESSTAKEDLLDILGGVADYSIEKLLDLGDGIPIVSYLTKGVKASLAVRDFLFMEKVIEFLRKIGEEPTQERRNMIKRIQENPSYNEKFGKVSLVALDRFDALEKAKLLGQAAKYLSMEQITFSLYKRISFIIGRLYIADIHTFSESNRWLNHLHFVTDLEALGLVKTSYGLLKMYSDEGIEVPNDIGSRTTITDLGNLIKCIALKQESLDEQVLKGNNKMESFVNRLKKKYP